MSSESYPGHELDLASHAYRWKSYFASLLRPHLGPSVLEVGAGLGGTTQVLARGHVGRWLCLEPDARLASHISEAIVSGTLPASCRVETGTLSALAEDERFDSILYIDVLEHIENDFAEAEHAARHLNPGGKLIVLAPAYPWLYGVFDESIGHFRRYTKRTLLRVAPASLQVTTCFYLDSFGLLASAGNRFILHASLPTRAQIGLWDRVMVPLSQVVDPLLGYSFGRSVIGIWQKELS